MSPEWKAFLERKEEFVGGNVILLKSAEVLCGEVSSIQTERNDISFRVAWAAERSVKVSEKSEITWTYFIPDDPFCSFDMRGSEPLETTNGRLEFSIPFFGEVTLVPRNDPDKLKKEDVKGLPPSL